MHLKPFINLSHIHGVQRPITLLTKPKSLITTVVKKKIKLENAIKIRAKTKALSVILKTVLGITATGNVSPEEEKKT